MDANQRKEYAAQRLGQVKSNILDYAGRGDEAVSKILSPEQETYRQMLRARLAAERGRTYTYKDPNKIPTGSIPINMGSTDHVFSRPGGWGDTKAGKKEKKKAKKAAKVGGGFQGSSQAAGSTGTSGYSGGSGGIGGAPAGGSGLAGTSGGTLITGTGTPGYGGPGYVGSDDGRTSWFESMVNGQPRTETSGGGWLKKLIAAIRGIGDD